MNYDKLKAELAEPAYADLSDTEAAELLNAKTIDSTQPISSAELLAWAGLAGRLARIDRAANDNKTVSNDNLRSVAMAAMKMIERDNTTLDLSLADREAMLDVLVAGGVLTPDDKTSLQELVAVEISRAEELELGVDTVYPGHVENARM